MQLRDVMFFLAGVAVCGAAVGVVYATVEKPAAVMVAAAPPSPARPVPASTAAATPAGGTVASSLEEPWGPDVRLVYTEDGPRPCPEACVAALAEALLSGDPSQEDADLVGQLGEAVGAYVAADGRRRQRLLAVADGLTSGDHAVVYALMSVARGLPPEAAEALARRVVASRDPEMRPMGLSILFSSNVPPERQARAVREVIGRERDGELLVMALQYTLSMANDSLDPGTLSAVRDMARYGASPDLRGAALASYARFGPADEAGRLIEEALASNDPERRLMALYAMADRAGGAPGAAEAERARAMLTEIANDPAADAEMRMAALGMLAYQFAEDGAVRVDD